MRLAAHTPAQLLATSVVLVALMALAAFSLWGMKPSTATSSATTAAPAATTTVTTPRREGGDG